MTEKSFFEKKQEAEEKIETLKDEDIESAAKVFQEGSLIQIPKNHIEIDKAIDILKKHGCFVYKEKEKIIGLMTFTKDNDEKKIDMNFICALEPKKGIGKKLMKKLANFAEINNIKSIHSTVSSEDKRAMAFYERCGFEKYEDFYKRKDFLLYKIKASPENIKLALKK